MKYQTLLLTEIKIIMRHRVRRATMGKTATKHSATLVSNIGNASVTVPSQILVQTDVGSRIASGTVTTLQDNASSASVCTVGTIVKYINICIQAGSRQVTGDVPVPDDNGWLEYALVYNKTTQLAPTVANLGTRTLGDICTTNFRGDVIHTGCLPVGSQQPTAVDLKIKLPKIFCKLQWGSVLTLFFFFRSVNSADARTDSLRVITSALFKAYS